MNILIGSWYPKMERSKFASYIFAGLEAGTVIGMLGSGWLCSSDFLGGWPSVFYIPGVLSIIWAAFWMICIKDHAEDHPWISEAELQYIKEGCPKTKNGLYSALPYLGGWIFSVAYGNIMDYFLNKGKISLVNVRKLSMAIGGYGPTLCLIAMCFVNCNTTFAIVDLFISCTINAAGYCGFVCSYTDLSPNFAGTLSGFSNTISGIAGFITPYIMGVLTEDNETLLAWGGVFLSSALVIVVTSSVYVFFVTTETQPWNDPKPEKEIKGWFCIFMLLILL
ncbi:hypothetical protein Avbf_18811 [Armadillidium vulgare]|nr:hypothetical protein Avbf_18811 [Armadillidium vulgare]